LSVYVDYRYIDKRWVSLRRFAGITVDVALEAVVQGHVDVSSFFARLIYFLPFTSKSLEKVLVYSLAKASYGFLKKDMNLYEISEDEVPGFEPDEVDNVRSAFKSMEDLRLADVITPSKIRLKPDVINELIRHVAVYVAEKVDFKSLAGFESDAFSYPYKVVSGISSLYVMQKTSRLPKSYTTMIGLLTPLAYVKRDGTVITKPTIEPTEWSEAKKLIASLRPLRDRFEVEYFKAIGVLYDNKIIVRTYPLEVSGTFANMVVAPAYRRYYMLKRERKLSRGRPWLKQQ